MTVEVPYGWSPRPYQLPAWKFLEGGGERTDLCWHRKSGKDLFALSWTAFAAMKRPGVYWHILPQYNQARKTIWEGRTNAGIPYLDVFPEEIIVKPKENEMMLELVNGSIWQIQGADEPDKLVGPNPVGVVFSEWSLMNPDIYHLTIQPILESNGGWALFIYTARGRNHAYAQRERMRNNTRWFTQLLTIEDTLNEKGKPIVSKEQVEAMRKEGTPEAFINQEYYCSFEAPMRGAYYEVEMRRAMSDNRITKVPWEPNLMVHTSWDLGSNDQTVIWFFQQHYNEIRVIDLYANSGEGLAHYAKVLKEKSYAYGTHYAPHDITVQELGSGQTRIKTAKDLGITFRTVPKIKDVNDGIEAVRNMLPRCWFNEEKCQKGIEGLKGYRKEWNEKNQCYRDTPLHDWCSDYADAFRTFTMGIKSPDQKGKKPRTAKSDYSIFG